MTRGQGGGEVMEIDGRLGIGGRLGTDRLGGLWWLVGVGGVEVFFWNTLYIFFVNFPYTIISSCWCVYSGW